MGPLGRILGLAFRPWRLGAVAASVSLGTAAGAGAGLLAWYCTLLTLAWCLVNSEPYAWMEDWIDELATQLTRPQFWMGCIPLFALGAAVLGVITARVAIPMIQHRRSFETSAATVLLWPAVVALPWTVWLGCSLTWGVPTQWRDGTRLHWQHSGVVRLLSSHQVAILALVLSIPVVAVAHLGVRRSFEAAMRRYCRRCNYDRDGLPDGAACPECDTRPEAGPA